MEPNQEELIQLQKSLGWSTVKTADQLGVSRGIVFRWRNGKTPTPEIVLQLLRTWDAGAKAAGITNATPVWCGGRWEYLTEEQVAGL